MMFIFRGEITVVKNSASRDQRLGSPSSSFSGKERGPELVL